MAGAFTHFIICDVAKRRRKSLDGALWKLLNKYSQFLFLGAASPDLPYLSFRTGNINWADVMHYEKTNSIALSAHKELKTNWPSKSSLDEVKLIWLFGYISHLVADATIHPIVQAIVGPYELNKEEHRICEMTQDSLIFNISKNTDIYYAEFSSILKFCKESEYFNDVMKFWREHVHRNYSDKGKIPDPASWFTNYTSAIDFAEGGSDIIAFFRHAGIGNYIYMPKDEIISTYKEHYKKYFEAVMLPNGNTGSFQKDGLEKTVNNVIDAWNKLYIALSSNAVLVNVVRNWYLDTGVDMDSTNKEVTFWA